MKLKLNKLLSKYYDESVENLSKQLLKNAANRNGASVILHNTRAFQSYLKNDKYTELSQNSSFLLADGVPISWLGKLHGFPNIEHIRGITLFKKLMSKINLEKQNIRVCMIVSTEKIKDEIFKKIRAEYSEITELEIIVAPWGKAEEIVSDVSCKIENFKPGFVWVCLGAPKQDEVGSLLREINPSIITLSVGVVAEYFAGLVKPAPKIFVNLKMEWFFRILVQPKRAVNFIFPFLTMSKLLLLALPRFFFKESSKNG
jgi:N-acetylglucosaminyldiphosphoundecaprenol N-acetyl-beta-D-mannosaminyltransferase